MTLEQKTTARKPVLKKVAPKQPDQPAENKEVNLGVKDVEATTGEIPMHELMKAQRQIDENNKKAGIVKEPISRVRGPSTLPIANK